MPETPVTPLEALKQVATQAGQDEAYLQPFKVTLVRTQTQTVVVGALNREEAEGEAWGKVATDEFLADAWRDHDYVESVELLKPCFQVEFDLNYTGGDYNRVGSFAYVPFSLLEKHEDPLDAFAAHTGIARVHAVHYSLDEVFTNNGVPVRE